MFFNIIIVIIILKDPWFCSSFHFMHTFTIKQHFPHYLPLLREERQDYIYQHNRELWKNAFNPEEEVTRCGHRLDCGRAGESTVVRLKDREDSDPELKSNEN